MATKIKKVKLISKIEDVDGNTRPVRDLVDKYYSKLFNESYKLETLKVIEDIVDLKSYSGKEAEFFEAVLSSFDTIIKGNPEELSQIIAEFNKKGFNALLYDMKANNQTSLGGTVEKIFQYKPFRKSAKAQWLASNLNIKVCLYCNAHYTLTLTKRKKALFHFDHFFSKSRYPYLSLSFYNLIPSCSSCNTLKSKKEFTLDSHVHPYDKDFDEIACFTTNDLPVIDYIIHGKKNFKSLKLSLTPRENISKKEEKQIENHIDVFALDEIYKHHRDVVSELYIKAYVYNKERVKELMDLPLFKSSNEKLLSPEELGRFLVGNYTLDKDIIKRPLAKLSKDIAKEVGLIK